MVSHMTKMGLLLTIPLAIVYGITYFFGPLLFYYKPRVSPARIYYRVPEIYPSYNKGDLVIAKLPDMIQTDAPFIFRQITGTPGETFVITENALVMDGNEYVISHHNPNFPELIKATYTIPEDCFLLLNGLSPSLDSRYLGPFPKERILYKVKLLIPFGT